MMPPSGRYSVGKKGVVGGKPLRLKPISWKGGYPEQSLVRLRVGAAVDAGGQASAPPISMVTIATTSLIRMRRPFIRVQGSVFAYTRPTDASSVSVWWKAGNTEDPRVRRTIGRGRTDVASDRAPSRTVGAIVQSSRRAAPRSSGPGPRPARSGDAGSASSWELHAWNGHAPTGSPTPGGGNELDGLYRLEVEDLGRHVARGVYPADEGPDLAAGDLLDGIGELAVARMLE